RSYPASPPSPRPITAPFRPAIPPRDSRVVGGHSTETPADRGGSGRGGRREGAPVTSQEPPAPGPPKEGGGREGGRKGGREGGRRWEEHTSERQSRFDFVCRR